MGAHQGQTASWSAKSGSGGEEVYGQARYLNLAEQDVSADN